MARTTEKLIGELTSGRNVSSGVSFQLAVRVARKLEAYATGDATVIDWPTLTRFG